MKQLVMMKGAALLACVLMLGSCINERKVLGVFDSEKVTERRGHDGFEKIEILGSPTVYYTQADSFSVSVKGPKSMVDDIITEVDGHTLKVRNRGKIGIFNISVGDDDQTAVYVTSPDLTRVQLNGSGDFISNGRIDTDRAIFVLRGSGDIDVEDIICDECEVELVGSGDFDINRLEAKDVSVSLIGSGDIEVNLCNVETTSIALKGSGDIKTTFQDACRNVDCELDGSGDIKLSGEVVHLNQHKVGTGDIDTSNLHVK
jgi:uncharacterized Zn ribbon protein